MSRENPTPSSVPQEPPSPAKPPLKRKAAPKQKKSLLNPKQALFVSYYTDRKSETFANALRSALKAGYAQEYAEKILGVMSENVALNMADAMDRAGISDERLVAVLKDGLEANRVVSARIVKSRPTNIDEELAEANQNTDDFIEVPDHPTRHKFLDTAIKIKGSYAAEKHQHDLPPGSVIFTRPTDGGSKQPDNPAQAASG